MLAVTRLLILVCLVHANSIRLSSSPHMVPPRVSPGILFFFFFSSYLALHSSPYRLSALLSSASSVYSYRWHDGQPRHL